MAVAPPAEKFPPTKLGQHLATNPIQSNPIQSKKTKMKMYHLKTGRSLLAAITLGLTAAALNASAANKTWDGGGDGSSWSGSPANWDLDTAPVANDILFFDGTTGLAPNNNFAADTDFGGITFNASAGVFVISGTEIDLAAGAGVTNNSANVQTITANIDNNGANKVHSTFAASMVYSGLVRNNSIIKEGTNSLTLSGTVGNSGVGAIVNAGTLILAKTTGQALVNTVQVNTNGTLRIAGPLTDQIHFNQRVIMNGGVFQQQNTNATMSTLEEIASLSGSNLTSIVENGLAGSTNRVDIGGGNGHRGIYSGRLRDGAAGVLSFQVYRANNYAQLNGTNTYSGVTLVNNVQASGATRLIVNGQHTGGNNYTINGNAADRLAYLGGSGTISATVLNFNANSFLSPGGALSVDLSDAATFADTTAIMTVSNAVNLNTTTSTLELQINGTTPGTSHDQLNLAGTGSLSNNFGNLKLAVGYTPVVGNKLTIVKVQGTDPTNNLGIFTNLNGIATDLSQGATFIEPGTGKYFQISYRAEGSTFDMGAGLGNDIMLQVVAAPGANLTWRGNVNYLWDITTTTNWRTAGNVATTFGATDNVTFNDAGSNSAPVDLTTDLSPGNITFDASKNYVFGTSTAGKLTGTVVLIKTNTGTLTILTDNNNTGAAIINSGKLQIGTNSTTGTLSGTVTINANGTLAHNRSDDVTLSSPLAGSGALLHTGSGALILAANNTFSGFTTNSGGVLQLGTGVGTIGSVVGDVNVGSTNVLRYLYAGDVTIANTKSGSGTVIYEAASGNRTFTTSGTTTNINFTGSNSVATGIRFHCADGNGGYNLGNGGSATVADFSQVWLDRSATFYNQEFYLQGTGWTGDATPLGAMRIFGCTVSGPVHLLADTRFGGSINGGTIIGKIDGAFQLEVLGNVNSFILTLGPTNGPNTYASTLVTSGAIRAQNSGGISSGALTVDINGEVNVFGNNVTVANLNNGVGGAGVIYNKSTVTNGTLTVGTDDSSTAFDGTFGDGSTKSLSLTKVGAGTLTLSAVSTNTGTVAVNGGTLALITSGSFGNAARITSSTGATLDVTGRGDGTLTLNSGQTLGGSGTVNGIVVASSGSTVAPGKSVGTLTVNGNTTLAGALLMELNRTNAVGTNDMLVVTGTLTAGGTLTVTNIGPVLSAGNSFQLFNAGVSGFSSVNLQTNDVPNNVKYTWTDTIGANGKITVASVTSLVNQNPTNITSVVNGSNLELSWPADHTGWTLQAQTNALSVGLGTNWVAVPGSTLVNGVTNAINPANGSVFYRMVYP